MDLFSSQYDFLDEIGLSLANPGFFVNGQWKGYSKEITSLSSINNEVLGKVRGGSMADYDEGVKACCIAAELWMATPVTTRCKIVTEISKALEAKLKPLSELVAHEVGKPLTKAIAEVKEVIDACNSAVQYSKQSQLVVSHSSNHVAYEEWRPYGVIAVITPSYLQCAALGQIAWLALVTGNCVIWRGPVESPLVTISITKLIAGVLEKNNLTGSIFTSFAGGSELNKAIVKDTRIPLVSLKGNSQVGKVVKHIVVERFGKCLLESDRNNAITVLSDADIQLAVEAIVRDTVGTDDQGLSTCHRLFLHESIYGDVLDRLRQRYGSITIGNPLETGTELGLLFSHAPKKQFLQLIDAIKSQGGKILTGGSDTKYARNFVQPTIVEISTSANIVKGEWVFPVILVFKYQSWEEAIKTNNNVCKGSSNFIYTGQAEVISTWLRTIASPDMGNIYVNKPTTATRDSLGLGNESWKQYMWLSRCEIHT